MNSQPLVSICCLTYNHAPFIRQCLDGFLMQITDFPIEILIHDDASTDGTDAIIQEYAEKYPDLFFPLFEKENQFSKGKSSVMDIEYNYTRAKGKYIAYCEGDDYWTDPMKLQRQVDFLEANPEYSVCFHRCRYMDLPSGIVTDDSCGHLFNDGLEGVEITKSLFLESWLTQPLTMVFRKERFNPSWHERYECYRDYHEIYHLLNAGKGYLFSFEGGIHIKHKGGISSSKTPKEGIRVAYQLIKDLYSHNKGDHLLKDSLVRIIKFIIEKQYFNNDRCYLYIEYIVLTKDLFFLPKHIVKRLLRLPRIN